MRKLMVTAFLSLDGVVQAPGGPGEDDTDRFDLGGWTVPYFDEHLGRVMGELMGKPFDFVLGRGTYDIFADSRPNASEEEGGKPLNGATKQSSRGPGRPWSGSGPCSSRAMSRRASAH